MAHFERIKRLQTSNWPELDWSNDWVMLTRYKDFDRSIAMDARSGKLQSVFDVPYDGPYDIDVPRATVEGQMALRNPENPSRPEVSNPIGKDAMKRWSQQWRLT